MHVVLDPFFQEQESTRTLIVAVKTDHCGVACPYVDRFGRADLDSRASDFNQQLKLTSSCHLPQFTNHLEARTVWHSVFSHLKCQVMCLKLTLCSLKSDFEETMLKPL